MGRIKSLVVAMTFVVGSLGCAGFAALAEPAKPAPPAKQAGLAAPAKQAAAKAKPTGSRTARLYFLREKGILGAIGGLAASIEILIDGKSAGKVDMGTFFVVDRPPGVTKIATRMKLSMADYEIEVPIEAGKTYYFGVGTRRGGAPVQDLFNQAVAGSSGEQISSSSPFKASFAGAGLFRFEPAAGAAAIEKLKTP
ncbi:DUF2846 domain-containing protein [Bradyrhizobium daqingense]|uniref:Uncharacterized protein DUF2846 n=1 Tax=Bradyrhizobium daqingense TaxID=993502 RepID=A0A562LDE9_9BRAD|nr:DUF2846 domain-containing protein [Bradyrhizobium daqingense]TWI05648.1 uncharacterized protein DUF2846 [Bradyrhizobium daqingense]UFS91281.1 DUF2846 domain-containing protein [Bradyrhizobium daqingense]